VVLKFVLKTPKDARKMLDILENLKKKNLLGMISFIEIIIAPKKFEYLPKILKIVNKVSIRKVIVLEAIKDIDNKFVDLLQLKELELHAS